MLAASAATTPLVWVDGPGFRSAALPVSASSRAGFARLYSEATGINFTNLLAQTRHLTNQILLNGSGVTAGDVDGDGWCDLYFCGLDGPNKLYRNQGGWRFQDITEQAGAACAGLDCTGAAFADVDGDGDLDLVVNSIGTGTYLFTNDSRGRFGAASAPLNQRKGGMSCALGDLDGDGWLDLYVANYRSSALMDMPNTRFWFKTVGGTRVIEKVNGRPVTDPEFTNRFTLNARGGVEELGEVDVLFRNAGGTRFVPVPFLGGAFLDEDGRPLAADPFDWGLSVMIRDFDGDGRPDIYVCNDFDSPDRPWLNLGGGRFRALPRVSLRKTALFTMGIDFADINRDGCDDFLLLDMLNRKRVNRLTTMADRKPPPYLPGDFSQRAQYMLTALCLGRADGTFAEIGQLAGVSASDWAWTPIFLDVDLDGYEDLLVANGNERDGRNMDVAAQLRALRTGREVPAAEILQARTLFPHFHTPNLAFRNRGDLTFEEVGSRWGFADAGVSQGMALADLDNDGDQDVVVNNLNEAAGIYRNESGAPRLAVRLKGLPPNTRGVGATIKLLGPSLPPQSQQIICGGRYLSSDDPMRVFAAGSTTNSLTVEVTWRGGKRSVVTGVIPNRLYEVDEAKAVPTPSGPSLPGPPPWFADASALLGHAHHDEPFDDFARQPLLPDRLSSLGPGASWGDLNGDRWDDLIIASGKGGILGAFLNDCKGGFRRQTDAPFNQPVTRDQTTVLVCPGPAGRTMVLAGSANYEDGLAMGGSVRQYDVGSGKVDDLLAATESSPGPMALADIDGDGDLDVFVGGRVVPGRFPAPASSTIYRQAAGRWELDRENSSLLAKVGVASGTVFTDMDGDGDPDLALACHWAPLRLFRNDRGRFREMTSEWKLAAATGWWNGVTAGDLDGDGRLDLIASNWGRNTKYECRRTRPLALYHGDLDGDGTYDVIEAHFDEEVGNWFPERGLNAMANAFPFLREKWTTHGAYALAGVDELFGDRLRATGRIEATWLESTVFLNRGDHFEPRVLPVEAQFAPAFAICVADFDGDSYEDLFLGQNFFGVQPETPRYDAGRGLCLRGDGRGGFRPLSGRESGIAAYGEQRGAAVSDFDADGRPDLVVTQVGSESRLYRNTAGKPGLRVRLRGPSGNPHAVGGVVRLGSSDRWGPAREIHAGAGYWSQDSPIQVMARPAAATQLWVRWPGGKVTTSAVPSDAREVTVEESGRIQAGVPRR